MKQIKSAILLAMLLPALFMSSLRLNAQNVSSYDFVAFHDTLIHDSGTVLHAIMRNDSIAQNVPLGFSFNFGGINYDTVSISSNGFLAFLNTMVVDSSNTLAVATAHGPGVMPLWDNLSGSGPISHAIDTTLGTAPNRIFKLQCWGWYWDYSNSNSTSNAVISFEISLYEATNTIEFRYRPDSIPYNNMSGGATIGIFNNATDWQTLMTAGPAPVSSSTIFTTNISTKPDTGQVYQWEPAVTATGVVDSFTVTAYHNCAGPQFVVRTNNYIAGQSVKTYFGDNTTDSSVIISGNFGGIDVINHTYANSGSYTVKEVLYSGTSPIDSLQFTYAHLLCNTIFVQYYYDANNNCAYNNYTDVLMWQPTLTQVDSNNVPVDTIASTTGFYYTAYGNVGDIYKFIPISLPNGYQVSCPLTGYIADTLQAVNTNVTEMFGLTCAAGNNFDLYVSATTNSCTHFGTANINLGNTYCAQQNGVVTMNFSPKYTFLYSTPPPSTVAATTVTWTYTNLNATTLPIPFIEAHLYRNVVSLTPGDTVNYSFTIDPIVGDMNPADNSMAFVDTVTAAFDPNFMRVYPYGYITAGTKLTYAVGFENTGNDTATNIYVLDTLPNEVDLNSMRMISSPGVMNVTKYRNGTHNVIRFEFPNINLPDSVHHPENCTRMFSFSIDSKQGLSPGTIIDNRAGIYFDDNDVVMTNTAEDIIATPEDTSTLVYGISSGLAMYIFPNPATNELSIRTSGKIYTSFTITNSIGQVMMRQEMSGTETNVNVKQLPAGLYYINLKGAKGNEVRKFVKM